MNITSIATLLVGASLGVALFVGCSKSPEGAGEAADSSAAATRSLSGGAVPADRAERAKAAVMKEFTKQFTNVNGLWVSFVPSSKQSIQWSNLTVRVEPAELSPKQNQSGVAWVTEVYMEAELARNQVRKKGWTEWRRTRPLRFPVCESNGVLHVENNYTKGFSLPPELP